MGWFESRKKSGFPGTIVTWADGTDEEIAAMLEAHYNGQLNIHDYWTVGDERVVRLSAMDGSSMQYGETHAAQNITLVLSNVGGKTLSDGITECAFQVDQKSLLNETGRMNLYDSNWGWRDCDRRRWCNSTYKNAFPETIRGIFKEFINQYAIPTGEIYSTNDYFSLRATKELLYTSAGGQNEGSQVAYYTTTSNRIKYINGFAQAWWLRSVAYTSSYIMATTDGSDPSSYSSNASNTRGLSPFGCI